MKPLVVIGFLGSTLDGSKLDASRWNKWRPSVSLVMHEDLRVDRFVLLHGTPHRRLAEFVAEDIRSVSPETRVEPYLIDFADAWDRRRRTIWFISPPARTWRRSASSC
jgi:transcriptional regulatory protein RtcR